MIEAGVVVPHATIGIHKRRLPGSVNKSHRFIHKLVPLIPVEQQIEDLPNPVLVIRIEGRILGNFRFKVMITVAIHVIGKGEIKVPRKHLELSGVGVVIVVVVFTVGDIVVVNGFNHCAITEILLDIEIRTPPLLRGVSTTVSTDEGGDIRPVCHLSRTLIVGLPGVPLDFVEIPVGQPMLVKKLAVHLLDHKIEPVIVASILGTRRPGLIDHVELRMVRLTGLYSTQLEKAESHSLEKPLLTPVLKIDLLDD